MEEILLDGFFSHLFKLVLENSVSICYNKPYYCEKYC